MPEAMFAYCLYPQPWRQYCFFLLFFSCIQHEKKMRRRRRSADVVFRVSTEFRRHGIPSVFLLPSIPYSVRNWLKFCRYSVSFNSLKFRGISRNSVTFSCTEFRISLPILDRYFYVLLYVCHLNFFPYLSGYPSPRSTLTKLRASEKMKRNAKWG